METNENKQHVQVPNKMTEEHIYLKPGDLLIYATIKRHMNEQTKTCYPSLNTIASESGASINTVRAAIQNLVNSGYIEVTQKGRGKLYRFLKWDKFEPFSYDFLDNKELSFKEKAYILATQQYMFKNEDTQDGILTYNNVELSKRLNVSPSTISRMDNALVGKDLLKINTLTQKDQVTGLPIKEKIFHLNKLQQAVIFILGNHEQRIQSNENRMESMEERMTKLEMENKELRKLLETKN